MVLASEIAAKFNLQLIGDDCTISDIGKSHSNEANHLYWLRSSDHLKSITNGVVIVSVMLKNQLLLDCKITYLLTSESPRLIFAKTANQFFPELLIDSLINNVDSYRKNTKIFISDYCFIGKNVEIGNGTIIHPNTTIYANTIIGKNCIIMSNCSIGSTGIGFEFEEDKIYKFPQVGNVIIEDGVEIGPNSTIRRGALGSTIIRKETKIGSLTNIGHNCIINEQALLTGNCIIAGSSIIGKKAFIGVNAVIKNKVKIGANATVGMGSNVICDIPDGEVWAGVPAKKLK